MRLVDWFFKVAHRHKWETTHTNQWIHPTKQNCKCGLTREFQYKANADETKGMPWEQGEWVWSDGTTSKYCISF